MFNNTLPMHYQEEVVNSLARFICSVQSLFTSAELIAVSSSSYFTSESDTSTWQFTAQQIDSLTTTSLEICCQNWHFLSVQNHQFRPKFYPNCQLSVNSHSSFFQLWCKKSIFLLLSAVVKVWIRMRLDPDPTYPDPTGSKWLGSGSMVRIHIRPDSKTLDPVHP